MITVIATKKPINFHNMNHTCVRDFLSNKQFNLFRKNVQEYRLINGLYVYILVKKNTKRYSYHWYNRENYYYEIIKVNDDYFFKYTKDIVEFLI